MVTIVNLFIFLFQKQAQVIRQLQDELQCQYELSRTIRDTEIQSVPRDEYEAVRLERERSVTFSINIFVNHSNFVVVFFQATSRIGAG